MLFIGNSLTYANDLPDLVAQLARADGGPAISAVTVAYPNFSLGDHLARGDARQRLAQGGWDVVVLQQGPSALPESRVDLIASAEQIAALAPRGTRLALYGVWPASDRPAAFDSVTASYGAAAHAVHGLLLPAGRAWTLAWQRDRQLPLYGPDGFHPSAHGSLLAALVIYEGITGRSSARLPASLRVNGQDWTIPPGEGEILLTAAAESLVQP